LSHFPSRTRLGELLVKNGTLSDTQLAHALEEQTRLKLPLGQVLLRLNYVTDETMRQALGQQLNVPYVDLEKIIIDRSLARLIDRKYARKYSLFPVAQIGTALTVAMDDPTQAQVIEDLASLTGGTITVVTASHRAIQKASSLLYGEASDASDRPPGESVSGAERTDLPAVTEPRVEPADDLLTVLLGRALDEGASELYLVPHAGTLGLSFRVDGVTIVPKLAGLDRALASTGPALVSRVKALARIDDSGRVRPRRGSAQVWVVHGGRRVALDLRVSLVPTIGGDDIAIRLLDPMRPKSPSDLGFSTKASTRLEELFGSPNGVVLVTGPGGSGRAATLYSFLRRLHAPGRRIVTIEEQTAHIHDNFSQVEVDSDVGGTFAGYLHAYLRHHPEVILLGDLGDRETATMAFRAAEGGCLLLSTLTTSRAVEVPARLQDLGVTASEVASSLVGVVAQRLVRRICPSCRRPVATPPEEALSLFATLPADFSFFEGAGCPECHFTGYRGHFVVADVWALDQADRKLVAESATRDSLRQSAARAMLSMASDAHDRLATGATTSAELVRALPASAVAEHRAWFSTS
jgi:type IV pilus assembly protein PilB